jgi:hypothetical protein
VPSLRDAPQIARVDVETLHAIRADLPPDSAILVKVDELIETAEQKAWPL